jgi:hypothetical protein
VTYQHTHVSELPDPAGVVECTWATGVELARAALAGSSKQPPATAAEREALRASGGGSDTAGATYEQLAMGLGARYGLHVVPTLALPAPEIPEGTFLGVQGLYSSLPAHYRRWDLAFTGAHSLVVYKLNGVLTVCDPLAPWDPTWHGEPITWAAVCAYHDALTGAKVIAVRLPTPPGTSTGEVDMALGWTMVTEEHGTLTWNGPGHAALRLRDGVTVNMLGGSTNRYYARIKLVQPYPGGAGGLARQVGFLIGIDAACALATDVTAVPDAPAALLVTEDTSPFTQADIDAAIAADRAKARVTWQ